MKARFSKLTLVTVALLSLTACSQSKPDASKSSAKEVTKQTSTKSSAKTSVATDSSKKGSGEASSKAGKPDVKLDAGVTYNGSYYSVKGKYGEVMVANKHYPLSPDFNPGEDPKAVAALHELIAAMQAEGYPISDQYSGFRSYETQVGLYQNYVNQDGQAAADRYSARPGYSEHHTGLAVDIVDQNWYNSYSTQVLDASYGDQPGAKWIAENAPKFGFIIRYPKDRQDITGITYEPWHIRYVGKENAEYITEHHLTLEEFLKQLSAK